MILKSILAKLFLRQTTSSTSFGLRSHLFLFPPIHQAKPRFLGCMQISTNMPRSGNRLQIYCRKEVKFHVKLNWYTSIPFGTTTHDLQMVLQFQSAP